MASEPTLDIDRLTSPVSEDAPGGSHLRDTDYERLQKTKDLRTLAVSLERKQRDLAMYSDDDLLAIPEQDRTTESPNWRAVREACVGILADHSKDLWVASWLIEANARLAGFAGFRDSVAVVTAIVENMWDHISPPRDEDEGYLGTVSQLTSLNGEDGAGTLIIPIETTALIPGRPEISLAAYRQATMGSGGDVTEAEIFAAARQVDTDRLRDHGEDIDQAIEAYSQMNVALAEKCGEVDGVPVAPPSSQIRNVLEECRRTFRLITRNVLSEDGEGDDPDGLIHTGEGGTAGTGSVMDPAKSQVANREDAFRLLLRASEFFRKTEPHSPVSYMLQQAVRFGRMELPDLLQELINDQEVLKRFAERTGIELKRDQED